MLALDVKDLRKDFQVRQKERGLAGSLKAFVRAEYKNVEAVHSINFQLEKGEALAFIGPNGAGKSTTIKMLTGILFPSSGEAQVLGHIPWKDRKSMSYKIATVFGQKSQLWHHLPPIDAFYLLAKIYEVDDSTAKQRIKKLVDEFELGALVNTATRKLSLGERMRCEIAAALIHRPEIIFLDEPTIGLDVIAKQKVREHILKMNREEGITVFLTSHDAGDIEKVCKRVIVINHGTLVLDTEVQKLRSQYVHSKIVRIRLKESISEFNLKQGEILKHKESRLKLKIPNEHLSEALAYIMQNYPVEDVTIDDPPLETIIANIYQDKKHEVSLSF